MSEKSLQLTYAPESICFGCGPANESGLRINSFVDGDNVVADWSALKHHEAFPGVLNGGIIGTLLDCHCNWTAAYHLMKAAGEDQVPSTVTADYSVKLLRPTPSDEPVHLRAWLVELEGSKAVVEGELSSSGKVCATSRGTFVAVKPGHPAYFRW
ncbi:MAG: Thioesterase superfamily protein [Candidatus Scalindua rubra]|uniref:Thioesterase superfamily protein n=1 Tax=Candidatus Scalindua rubra TaxID=1872076 RepID=A0A1E3X5T3_9BACT|nr:MAG: Thioesterase superfamily protein [Candidatus Scalindua rubra]